MILRIKRKKINKILLCSVLFWVLLVYIFDSVSKKDNLKELKELKMKESINAVLFYCLQWHRKSSYRADGLLCWRFNT